MVTLIYAFTNCAKPIDVPPLEEQQSLSSVSSDCYETDFMAAIDGTLNPVCSRTIEVSGTMCPEGYHIIELRETSVRCAPIPYSQGGQYICPTGQQITGVIDGQKQCHILESVYPYASQCPPSLWLRGINKDTTPPSLVCVPSPSSRSSTGTSPSPSPSPAPQPSSEPGGACVAGATQACSIANGTGVKTCVEEGTGFGACITSGCNDGFSPSSSGLSCDATIVNCTPGQSQSCSILRGLAARTCAPSGKAWEPCKVLFCNTGRERLMPNEDNTKCVSWLPADGPQHKELPADPGFEWFYERTDGSGCRSCSAYNKNQVCNASNIRVKAKFRQPGSTNNDYVYRCRVIVP